jgi:2-oxo-3-hexenedioate decarboxylase
MLVWSVVCGKLRQSNCPDTFMSDKLAAHDDIIDEITRELSSAYETGTMVATPPSQRPGFNLDAAYAVEAKLKQLRADGGYKAVGRKVGYANKAMWRVFKLETLVWAHMYDDTVHYSDKNSATLALSKSRSLKIEPEIVFGLKERIAGEKPDAGSSLAAVEWLAMGFEIIDCPFPDWQFQPSDFVASFGLHAALVIGERVQVGRDNIATLIEELGQFKVRVSKNGEFIEEGSGKNSLKSPALCLAELSVAIAKRFPSAPLGAGEIVSSGTLTAGHFLEKNDVWKADLDGISLPSLTLRFE